MTKRTEKQEEISAFAYETGKAIENFLNFHNGNLHLTNQLLEAKILDFHAKHKDFTGSIQDLMKIYKATFNIIEVTNGKIDLGELDARERGE